MFSKPDSVKPSPVEPWDVSNRQGSSLGWRARRSGSGWSGEELELSGSPISGG